MNAPNELETSIRIIQCRAIYLRKVVDSLYCIDSHLYYFNGLWLNNFSFVYAIFFHLDFNLEELCNNATNTVQNGSMN
ncbi:hypothetical protein BLOT_001326 [Blomia tropicalis]|nr:hypothetical protein BLOT_001326 [Blomia tropicalis]